MSVRTRLSRFLAAACVLFSVAATCSQAPADRAFERALLRADSTVQAAVDTMLVPGAVLLVARDGEIVLDKAYGWAQLFSFDGQRLESPEPMSVNHVFDLASLTKVMATTFGVMKLVDAGAVDLDAPVSRYLPEFSDVHKDSVTVRLLLLHTAGFSPWRPVYYHATDAAEARRFVTAEPLAYPVGAGRHYSDLSFMLLGYVIEEVSGRPLDRFLQDEVYAPLGLDNTAFRPRERGLGPFAATSHGNPFERRMVADDGFGYLCDEDVDSFAGWRQYTLVGEVNDGNAFHAHGGVAGHAGLFSAAHDLKVLMDLLLDRGSHQGRQFISSRVVDEFLTPGSAGNGLGWIMSPDILGDETAGTGAFGHTGFTGTYALGLPKHHVSIILLTNRQNLGVGPDTRYNNVNPLRRAVSRVILEGLGVSPVN